MSKNQVVATIHPRPGLPKELTDLVQRCYRNNPDKKDIQDLRQQLEANPDLWHDVADLSYVLRSSMIKRIGIEQDASRIGVEAGLECMCRDLGYSVAPMVEKLLIDNILNTWLFLQWAELQHMHQMTGEHTQMVGEYWTKIIAAAQHRHIRACEALARVRRLALTVLQLNINAPDGQQVNIAGDLINKPEENKEES